MNVITPVTSVNPGAFEYQANGKIVRVFDTNGAGELLPVEYRQHADDNKFALQFQPFGMVYAEVVR
ncbi:hypothetical protein CLU93_5431 [Janthinobacterium sp. 35]|uniref:hypothetical protein n=1 Tax=Janthinobacterium sp. 35 TaxID=2035210 RepID=UPI000C18E56B|nr:hypothetical protein [Janthinobacterium sp. 35]PIG31079.1 hypothetical protein CLU93_5431 [Janthinobacterium sp. 35]